MRNTVAILVMLSTTPAIAQTLATGRDLYSACAKYSPACASTFDSVQRNLFAQEAASHTRTLCGNPWPATLLGNGYLDYAPGNRQMLSMSATDAAAALIRVELQCVR